MSKTLQTARVKCAWTMVCIVASLAIAQDSALHIKVVAGDGVQNAAGSHGKPLTVEVTDATGRPVAGARVSFQVPEEGPGGLFANGLRTDIAITDSNGRATEHGLQLNRVAGSVAIRITAAKEQQRAGTIARQFIGNAETAAESADRKAPALAAPHLPARNRLQHPRQFQHPPSTRTSTGAAASGNPTANHHDAGNHGDRPRQSSGSASAANSGGQSRRRVTPRRADHHRHSKEFEVDYRGRRR